MLLNSYKITRPLPCLADPEKIRMIAEVSGEIYEAFPYLNTILKGCIYNHPALTLTIKKNGKLLPYMLTILPWPKLMMRKRLKKF